MDILDQKEFLDEVRKKAIIALFSDDYLMDRLVLKGGSAIDLIYGLSKRGSIDLDFSMEGDFTEAEVSNISNKIRDLLQKGFSDMHYKMFDYKFQKKPKESDDPQWGGYKIEFKLIEDSKYDENDLDKTRRQASSYDSQFHKKFTIDISKYELVKGKTQHDIDDYTVYVYTTDMIIIEKIRAICQQNPSYKSIIKSSIQRPRSRDFYDIYVLLKNADIEEFIAENTGLIEAVFDQKKVPISYLGEIRHQKELHESDYSSIRDALPASETLESFDILFKFVTDLCQDISESISAG